LVNHWIFSTQGYACRAPLEQMFPKVPCVTERIISERGERPDRCCGERFLLPGTVLDAWGAYRLTPYRGGERVGWKFADAVNRAAGRGPWQI